MELKTKLSAGNDSQAILIEREFDMPLELLFKAYCEPVLIQQWMGTKVLELENKKSGSWLFQTPDTKGNVLFRAGGVIHAFIPNRKIVRTFEMENTPFDVQLEFLEFEKLSENSSKLSMEIIYKTTETRDQMMQTGVGMAKGLDMIHNKLEKIVNRLR